MTFILSSENVLEYLKHQGICQPDHVLIEPVEQNDGKNFNLVVNVTGNNHYLVKQERFVDKTSVSNSLMHDWVLHQLLNNFPELKSIRASPIVKCDLENSIIVMRYLPEHISLAEFYRRKNDYPPQIAAFLGTNLAQLHRLTFKKLEYREFMRHHTNDDSFGNTPHSLRGLERVGTGNFWQYM